VSGAGLGVKVGENGIGPPWFRREKRRLRLPAIIAVIDFFHRAPLQCEKKQKHGLRAFPLFILRRNIAANTDATWVFRRRSTFHILDVANHDGILAIYFFS